ncbi:MAG: homocysteine biosynthesis protein [Desulfovibrio sp.]|jgi:uncharacterized protein (DUF39 family)|nr:homocysteine biosynthesis protein [Desulfovibrio sp.]
MAKSKSIAEINARIKQGKAVVLNAAEMTETVKRLGKAKAAREVDVVTTGTFSPMCSSGLLFNIGQQSPPALRASQVSLNNVPAYAGLAAVDSYLGATEPAADDPLNKVYPGKFKYGGGHVIEDLVKGRPVRLKALSYGTDCYPNAGIEREITLAQLPFAQIFNPRNCYQNYNVAVNVTNRTVYTYMGPLKPNLNNCNYATAGLLSPLFNDPYLRTIGLGTKIFLAGGVGWVLGAGTQHNARPKRGERGLPLSPAGTLMLRGDLKGMNARYLRGLSFLGYGCTLAVGVGIPIPILDEDMAFFTGVANEDILMPVKDYGHDYPHCDPRVLRHVPYSDLMTGEIDILDKKVPAIPLTSYSLSLEIANALKDWIAGGEFTLTEAQEKIPSA